MHNVTRIFDFMSARAKAGERTALVTVISVTGASVRNPGAHLAVAESGGYTGSLSGGCIEAAVVEEAIRSIRAGVACEFRYGAGSPVIDIRLPCGGSVDLLFNPVTDARWAGAVGSALARRETVRLDLERLDNSAFSVSHAPPLRLLIMGHGASVEALAAQAGAIDAEVSVLTPDEAIAARIGPRAKLLRSRTAPPDLAADGWTAIVSLFHDHDWEVPLLGPALQSNALYIGAMGSRATHARRSEMLLNTGLDPADVARIRSPVGIIPSSRDPETLALSTLTEIVHAYNQARPTRTDDSAEDATPFILPARQNAA